MLCECEPLPGAEPYCAPYPEQADPAPAPPDGGVTTLRGGCRIHTMLIAGQIEGHYAASPQTKSTKYEHCVPSLVAVEESDCVDGLLLLLNTVGGDIEAGLGIAELIAGMAKPTASLVLGGGHSIGVPLAVSAKRSFVAASAAMTIHPARMNGVVVGAPQTYEYFAGIQERIVRFVTAHSRISRESFEGFMLRTGQMANDVGSILTGEEAVACGLMDAVGTLSDALAWLHGQIS